ncbi:MAG: hypothetical protein O7J95_11525 [Planctomycetota bacterium]|nr:hypothetical protein [Planctomycetota bacterium]
MLLAAGILVCGCSAIPIPDPLPFLVRVNVDVVDEDAPEGVATPARFDESKLAQDLASALEEANLFTGVVAGQDPGVEPDLDLVVVVHGSDFGEGSVDLGGAISSTFAWFFGGHFSWWIENRRYSSSDVRMVVRVVKGTGPGEEVGLYNSGSRFVNQLRLSFAERLDVREGFFNILLPPWCREGNPEVAGSSLKEKCIGFLTAEVERAVGQLPVTYYSNEACFLGNDPATGKLIILARELVKHVDIIREDGTSRAITQLELDESANREENRAYVRGMLSSLGFGIDAKRYYVIQLADDDRGLLRVRAQLAERQGRWSIRRDGAPLTPVGAVAGR